MCLLVYTRLPAGAAHGLTLPYHNPVKRLLERTRLPQAHFARGAPVTGCSVVVCTARALLGSSTEGPHWPTCTHRARRPTVLLCRQRCGRQVLADGLEREQRGGASGNMQGCPPMGSCALQTAASRGQLRVRDGSGVSATARLEAMRWEKVCVDPQAL